MEAEVTELTGVPYGERDPERRLTVSLAAVIADPHPRQCSTPIGAPAWIRVLGAGGAEETDEAFA